MKTVRLLLASGDNIFTGGEYDSMLIRIVDVHLGIPSFDRGYVKTRRGLTCSISFKEKNIYIKMCMRDQIKTRTKYFSYPFESNTFNPWIVQRWKETNSETTLPRIQKTFS